MPSPVMRAIMSIMKKSASVTYATWNPADKGSFVTLSGGNLTATMANTGRSIVRSTLGKSSGKWYWEVKKTDASTSLNVGIATSTAGLNTFLGADAQAWGYEGLSGANAIYNNGSAALTAATYVQNDVIGIALDMNANTCAFYKNNVLQNTASIAAGTWFAAVGDGNANGEVGVANFGASALTFSPPSGFNAGLYV